MNQQNNLCFPEIGGAPKVDYTQNDTVRVQIPRYDVEIKNKTMFSPTHVHLSFVFIFGMCISVMECFIFPPL